MGHVNIKAIIEEVPLHFIIVKVLAVLQIGGMWRPVNQCSMLNLYILGYLRMAHDIPRIFSYHSSMLRLLHRVCLR